MQVHAETQKDFDTSVRTLAAAGVGIAASLATALNELGGLGTTAIVLFLASLTFNVLSFATAQLDMNARMMSLREGRSDGVDGNRWTTTTTICNIVQGIALIAGGAVLASFVASAV